MVCIGVIGAMEEEVASLINQMEDAESKTMAGMTFNKGKLWNQDAVVVQSGIGKVNMAICTQILVNIYGVDMLINTGVAGGLYKDINVGDIVISSDALQHDFDETGLGYKKSVIPGMETSVFTADTELVEMAKEACEIVNPEIQCFVGRVVTGDQFISDKEKKITAFHEAGHAILFHVLPDVGPVYSVSIIPTGVGAAGYTMPLPEKDEMFNTKGKMLQDITVSLGGRVAEELIFDDITTGASQDIKQATAYAKSMVTKFGMSEALGLVSYGDDNDEVFIGRDFGHTSRGYGEQVATTIDSEVKRIIDECYDRAKTIIKEHEAVLYKCADLLLEKEKITREEFEALFEE